MSIDPSPPMGQCWNPKNPKYTWCQHRSSSKVGLSASLRRSSVFLRFIPQPTSLENMRLPILLVLAAACIAAEAKTLARELAGTVPVIAGSGLTAPIAGRW